MFLSLLTLIYMCDLKGQLLTSPDSDFFFFGTVFIDISGLCIKPSRSVLLAVFSLSCCPVRKRCADAPLL